MKFPQGEFRIQLPDGCEHVVPNQFTTIGMQQILRRAFWGDALTWYAGLCAKNPGDVIPLNLINEPAVLNGYDRQTLPLDINNWPTINQVNGESYVETRDFTFNLSGATSIQVNRLFLTDGNYVIAISSAFQAGLQFLSTPLTTRYRLYFR